MFLVNSRLGLFSAAPGSSRREADHHQGLPFSRSYGDILPSSLATLLSIALESSSRLPVSVCGTGTAVLARGFSWRHGIDPIGTRCLGILSGLMSGGFTYLTPYLFASGTTGAPSGLSFPVTPLLKRTAGGVGMLTNCPSPTPFGLGLGPTDPGTSNVAQETLDLRRTRFSRVSRYLCRHSHFCPLHQSSRSGFAAGRTLLYHDPLTRAIHGFGCKLEPRSLSAPRHSTSELLRTL